jgi:hypothetical protein
MDQDEIKTALASLHSLFKDVYVLNCQIDCDFADSTELKLIEDFDFSELVDNFRDIVLHLVAFKQDHAAQGAVEQISLNSSCRRWRRRSGNI